MDKVVTFTVRGRGIFPFDMLRYDRCWPKHETSSGEIERSTRPRFTENNVVVLEGLREPTVGRWESFGWEVI